MKYIPLTRGQFAIVDDKDYDYLMQWQWYAYKAPHVWYAKRADGIIMHRLIMRQSPGDPGEVDHLNGNGLDNRRENLRICSHSLNMQNMHNLKKGTTSKYQGVCWDKSRNKWMAYIAKNYKQTTIGRYENPEDAAKAYDARAAEMYGEYAKVNFPEKVKA